jgi:nitrite reductase/ring-hydroxylating ferredoxin subunit
MKLTSIVSFSSLLLPSAASFATPPSAVVGATISRKSSSATARVAAAGGGAKIGANDSRPSASASSSSFADFDYLAHWYPANWACNLVLNAPQKVTIFDVDYVVARISETDVVAMVDECPHKAASLSEGRVTSTGNFQCAYHGWSFDGKTGSCVEIPQVVGADGSMPGLPSRSRGKAVPAMIHQGMVWLFPGGGLEEALLAPPPPPSRSTATNIGRCPRPCATCPWTGRS